MTPEETIRIKEDELRQLRDLEAAFAMDKNGTVLLDKTSTEQFRVEITDEEVARLRAAEGVIFTHNHPRGWTYPIDDPRHKGISFSPEDILLACRAELAEVRAVGPIYRFSMKPPATRWNESFWPVIEQVYIAESDAVKSQLGSDLLHGRITVEEYKAELLHLTWERVANLLGMQYNRTED